MLRAPTHMARQLDEWLFKHFSYFRATATLKYMLSVYLAAAYGYDNILQRGFDDRGGVVVIISIWIIKQNCSMYFVHCVSFLKKGGFFGGWCCFGSSKV